MSLKATEYPENTERCPDMVAVIGTNNHWQVIVDGRVVCTTSEEEFARRVAAAHKRQEQETVLSKSQND